MKLTTKELKQLQKLLIKEQLESKDKKTKEKLSKLGDKLNYIIIQDRREAKLTLLNYIYNECGDDNKINFLCECVRVLKVGGTK